VCFSFSLNVSTWNEIPQVEEKPFVQTSLSTIVVILTEVTSFMLSSSIH
jgi:hypothetical protein